MDENYTQNNQYTQYGQTGQNNQYTQYGQAGQNSQYTEYGQTNQNSQYTQYGQAGQNSQYTEYGQTNQNSQYTEYGQAGQTDQYTQYGQPGRDLQNYQSMGNVPPAEKKEESDPKNDWKMAIGLGVVNVVLAILCGSFRVRVMSVGLVIFLLAGIYGSFTAIKGGIKSKYTISVILGVVAMVINVAATAYYIWSIIYTIGSKFS